MEQHGSYFMWLGGRCFNRGTIAGIRLLNEEGRKQREMPRIHMAAFRIHRFWRDVCSNTQLYAHARRCVQYAMESEGAAVLGKRMRE